MAFGAPVPRVFSYGSMIEGMPFIWGGSIYATSDEQAREIVDLEKKEGAVGVKSYFTLSWPLHRAVAFEAFKQGLPVAAHGLFREEIVRGALLGHAREEHMLPVNVYYDDLLQLLAATGTYWTPTFAVEFGLFPEGSPIRTAMLAELKRAYQAGVPLLAGTDSLNPQDNYGQALHEELQNFVRAGIPPIEVLRIATQRSASAVGAGDLLGSLEPGKLADVVLLDANPLDDIAEHTDHLAGCRRREGVRRTSAAHHNRAKEWTILRRCIEVNKRVIQEIEGREFQRSGAYRPCCEREAEHRLHPHRQPRLWRT